jgi:enamine deaminase RidA (YjgF/YER057c/UK114 family)
MNVNDESSRAAWNVITGIGVEVGERTLFVLDFAGTDYATDEKRAVHACLDTRQVVTLMEQLCKSLIATVQHRLSDASVLDDISKTTKVCADLLRNDDGE